MEYTADIVELKGVGEKTAALFARKGITTVGQLLDYYPRDYELMESPVSVDELQEGSVQAVAGRLAGTLQVKRLRSMQIAAALIRGQNSSLSLVWYQMPYLKNTLKPGISYVFRGKTVIKKGVLTMEHPAIYTAEEYEKIQNIRQPVYGLTEGLSNKLVTKIVKGALDTVSLEQEFLPESLRKRYELAEYNFAIHEIHFPTSYNNLIKARRRLVFQEFFTFIMALRRWKETVQKAENHFLPFCVTKTEKVFKNLPFELTGAQKKVWKEVLGDLQGQTVMNRLIQGDVGSGKTIIAVLALFLMAENGYQGAMMVPTEVLARQQYESVSAMLQQYKLPFEAVLLTGSMTAKEKRETYEKISSGKASIIIGTHALIQEKVHYHALGLVITDEQHRFGVRQRENLAEKGKEPHVLVMSATPIPRTLAIVIYGDLELSVIDEIPAERLPNKNCVVGTAYRPKAYEFIQKQVEEGRQAYVICPMVEESEGLEAENVIEYEKKLRQNLPSTIKTAVLHGKMKPSEKNDVMENFSKNNIQVLVSTTVVEVGVNVPNATVMMIEDAQRFGLAQLHQLRGRVGRGKYQSYCIFVCTSDSKKAKERLEILNHSNDGFFIASEDLKLRGPGDFFGVRQSGVLEFKIGDIYTDAAILQQANEAADELLAEDSQLTLEENQKLCKYLEKYELLKDYKSF